MKTLAVIPARAASTRLPGKPLADINGKPMIQWVWEATHSAADIDEVIIATDDDKIRQAAEAFGAKVLMTSAVCRSGTDRVREVMDVVPADIYLNIQGDEPLITSDALEKLVDDMKAAPQCGAGTLCAPISADHAGDPNLVKVVLDQNDNAVYFSRAPIPYAREKSKGTYWGHLGIYAYRPDVLRKFTELPPSVMESMEKLEQLRLLNAGIAIRVSKVKKMTRGVDTPADLDYVRRVLNGEETTESLEDKFAKIRLIITDVDGVLTDGKLYYDANGESLKQFNVRDGLGIILARKYGLLIGVASGRDCPALRARLADVGITHIDLGQMDKTQSIRKLMHACGIKPEETLILGDDLPDKKVFSKCAIAVTPSDAESSTRAAADWVASAPGGQGVLRETIEKILIARGINIEE